jgi:hypothetical protein
MPPPQQAPQQPLQQAPQQPPAQQPPAQAQAAPKPVWTEYVDKASGKTYYYNQVTRQTSWTKVSLFVHHNFV